MAETGRLVAFYGAGEPMRIEEYPVPEPEPGAIVVRTTLANVCGSDLHVWRGDQYPFDRIVSDIFPLEEVENVLAEQNKGHITRAALKP